MATVDAVCGGLPRVVAIGRCRQVGGATTFSGHGVASLVDNGAGDTTFTLDHPVDATEGIVMITMADVTAARCKCAGYSRPADATVRVLCQLEAASGAAVSVDTDLEYDLLVMQYSIR